MLGHNYSLARLGINWAKEMKFWMKHAPDAVTKSLDLLICSLVCYNSPELNRAALHKLTSNLVLKYYIKLIKELMYKANMIIIAHKYPT